MRSNRQSGFTLLEVLVASLIMAVAVAGLLTSINTSLRNGARLTDADRASSIARIKMDELILNQKLPHNQPFGGQLPAELTGWKESGWQAIVRTFDAPPRTTPGTRVLEQIHMEIWWNNNGVRRTFPLDAYREGRMREGDPQVRQ